MGVNERGELINKNLPNGVTMGADSCLIVDVSNVCFGWDTMPIQKTVFYGEAGIYQPVDSAKYYYHKFLEFTRKMNNPKITRKKFDQYEDSCKRYFELLNRKR